MDSGAPVMVRAASEHRNTASAPICSGVVNSGIGCFSASRSCVTASTSRPSRSARAANCCSTSGVRTQPGQIALAVIPLPASSRAATWVRPSTPCLAAT